MLAHTINFGKETAGDFFGIRTIQGQRALFAVFAAGIDGVKLAECSCAQLIAARRGLVDVPGLTLTYL